MRVFKERVSKKYGYNSNDSESDYKKWMKKLEQIKE